MVASSTDAERFRTFDGVARALAASAALRAAVLIFEDLHAADPASLRLLLFVARLVRSMRVLLIGTYREAEARLRPVGAELLVDCGREARTLALRRLDLAETAALLSEGSLPEGEVVRVHRATDEAA